MNDSFKNDNPVIISDHYKEKFGISNEELGQEEEEETEEDMASLDELRESEEFQEAWRKSWEEENEKRQETEEQDPEELRQLAETMENRGGAWESEADRIREETEESEAEKIGKAVAKHLNSNETEELAQAEETDSEGSKVEDSDWVFIENENNTGTIFTESEELMKEVRQLEKLEDSINIISDNDSMEVRITDLESAKDRFRN